MQDFFRRNVFLVEDRGAEGSCGYRDGPIFGLRSHPGFLYMPAALFLLPPLGSGSGVEDGDRNGPDDGMRSQIHARRARGVPASESRYLEIARAALKEWCEHPHRTNLDGGASRPPRPAGAGDAAASDDDEEETERPSMWDEWVRHERLLAGGGPAAKKAAKYSAPLLSKKLSWATLGYHYDWTRRAYRAGFRSDLPPALSDLAAPFAASSQRYSGGGAGDEFSAEAAIVNYYGGRCTTMGGHRDDLELASEAPVVSASLGLPAVFLLGGHSRDGGNGDDGTKISSGPDAVPTVLPLLVRPGDVMVLGGESRMRYHGVARILAGDEEAAVGTRPVEGRVPSSGEVGGELEVVPLEKKYFRNEDGNGEEEDFTFVRRFLSVHRINVNIRQVLPHGVEGFPLPKVGD
mmetsp:Transcript_30804/g.60984  ORF Transcript_30804/g.60984 Transcript_30804/m.60984 type:complete len:405 (+) Transcript_30804:1-1215(+)